jgi:hypothetical protein
MNGFPSARSPRLTLHLGHLCRRHLQAVLAIEQLCHIARSLIWPRF